VQEEIQGLKDSKGALLQRIATLDADHEELHRRVSEVMRGCDEEGAVEPAASAQQTRTNPLARTWTVQTTATARAPLETRA
jgi:hypothetical protein